MTALPHDEKRRDSTPAPADSEATNYTPTPVQHADPEGTNYTPEPKTPLDPEATNYAAPDPEATRYRTGTAAGCRSPGPLPCRFGEYELLEEVAKGGMGIIYKARHERLGRVVALKMILAGRLASPELVQRFYLEARAAADLDHPGIVPIYEIGEVEGRHYFTMAFLPGGSLQQALEQGPLPPRVAARVVQQVAEAVQYAHDKGIIHRDIKPHNILLQADDRTEGSSLGPLLRQAAATGDTHALPVPRLGDFGLARLSEDSGLSVTGEALGTPSYMPPEQAAGKRSQVGPHSDIYSLGAVLYCLLTGRPPFQAASPLETLRLVQEQEPVPPRQLNPSVPRDLETICLKCLAKEPAKRYQSAHPLADDLARFQSGQPIQARRVGRLERGWKWVRRNKAVAGLLAALGVVIVGSLAGLTALYVNAERQRQLAEHREAEARTVSRFYEDHVLAAARPKGWEGGVGKNVTLKEALDQAGSNIEAAFAGQPELEAAVRNTLGMTYYYLGQFEAANPHLEKAHAIRLQVLGPDHPDTLSSIQKLANLRWKQGKFREAAALGRQALDGQRRVLGPEHQDTLLTQLNLGITLNELGHFDEAEALLRQAIDSCKRTLGPDHRHTLYGQNDLAITLWAKGKQEESIALDRQTLEGRRRSLGPDHPDTLRSMGNLASSLSTLGKLTEAEALCRQSLEARRRVLGPDHEETLWSESYLRGVLSAQGKLDEAEQLGRQTLETSRRVFGPKHPQTMNSQYFLAMVLKEYGKLDEAEKLFRQSLETGQHVYGPENPDTMFTQDQLAEVFRAQGKFDEAEKLHRKTLENRRRVLGSENPATLTSQHNLALVFQDQSKLEEAEKLFRQTLETQRRVLGPEHIDTLTSQRNLATVLADQSKLEEAEKLFRGALAAGKKTLEPDHLGVVDILDSFGILLTNNGRAAEAEPLLREGLAIREKKLPPSHWRIATSRSLLGGCLVRQQKFDEAVPLLLAGSEGLTKAKGSPAKEVAEAIDRLIELYEKWGKPEQAQAWRQKRPTSGK